MNKLKKDQILLGIQILSDLLLEQDLPNKNHLFKKQNELQHLIRYFQ